MDEKLIPTDFSGTDTFSKDKTLLQLFCPLLERGLLKTKV